MLLMQTIVIEIKKTGCKNIINTTKTTCINAINRKKEGIHSLKLMLHLFVGY